MTQAWRPTVLALAFALLLLWYQVSERINNTILGVLPTNSLSQPLTLIRARVSTADPIQEEFCHSDPALEIHMFSGQQPNRHACFGQCTNNTPTILQAGVQPPRLSSLCLLNPFHGFYDCIWPLVHYLTTCRPDAPPVIVQNAGISDIRRKKWAVRAQEAFLRHSATSGGIMDRVLLSAEQCICYRSLTKFPNKAFWRPTRFQYQQRFGNHTVIASHPATLKGNSLRLFRNAVLSSFGLNSLAPPTQAPLLIYSREDTARRIWFNAQDFVSELANRLPTDVPVLHIKRIPKNFEDQVRLHNNAAVLVAPHGAAMVNTLFMRESAVVVEIASRHCIDLNSSAGILDMDSVVNVSDPNAWVPWHAQSLGLHHISAPCFRSDNPVRRQGFVTENESLIKLILVALTFPRR